MMILRRSFLWLSVLCLGSFAPDPCLAEAPPKPAAGPAPDGMVWRVSGGNAPFFLAGSFHVLRPGDYPLPDSYNRAWQEARHLVMELPAGETKQPAVQAAMAEMAMLQEGRLQDRIAPETWEQLTKWSGESGFPAAALNKMKPWMAGLCVAIAAYEKLGFKNDLGLEQHFSKRLEGSGKTSEGLESTMAQLKLFEQIPAPMQEKMLTQALIQATTMQQEMTGMAEAWRVGDGDTLHRLMRRSFDGFPEIEKLLMSDRNAAWIPRLEALLKGDRATMVLVGAAHLCGPGSVVELLEAKGYRCVPLKAPAAIPSPLKKAS
jgi:uncharacterized protein